MLKISRLFVLDLLFAALMLSYAAVVISNVGRLPERIFLWGVLPIFAVVAFAQRADFPSTLIFKSALLRYSAAYVIILIISTFVSAGERPLIDPPTRRYLFWALQVLLFLFVFAYIAACYDRFLERFLLLAGALLATNALINIGFAVAGSGTTAFAERLVGTWGTPGFRNSTHIAPLYAMYGMALLALLVTQPLSSVQRWIGAISVAALVTATLLTQARGAIGSIIVAAFVIAIFASRRWRWWIVGLASFVLLSVAAIPDLRAPMLLRGLSYRPELFLEYLMISASQPWTGYGLRRELLVNVAGIEFEQPHNAFMWAQMRGGLLATVALMSVIAGSFYTALLTRNVPLLILMLVLTLTAMTEIGFMVQPYSWLWIMFWMPIGLIAGSEIRFRLLSTSGFNSFETKATAAS